MKTLARATAGSVTDIADPAFYNDLSINRLSYLESVGGPTTLVVVDMQERFFADWPGPAIPPVDAVIEQVKIAMAKRWSIVLLEMKPWRLGRTVSVISDLIEGYERGVHRSKQTPSGGKEVLAACKENGFGTALFRVTGVFLDACVRDTVEDLLALEPTCLVRMIEEGCSTDMNVDASWSDIHQRFAQEKRLAVSPLAIDR